MGDEMRLVCKTSKGHRLPADYRGLHFSEETTFSVSSGREYEVYEMALFNSGLTVLVVDDDRQPNWFPIDIFEVEDGALPDSWRFAIRDILGTGTQAVWGHARLVDDPALDDRLAEQEDGAREIFWKEVAN